METFKNSDLYNSFEKKITVIHLQWYCLQTCLSASISLCQAEKRVVLISMLINGCISPQSKCTRAEDTTPTTRYTGGAGGGEDKETAKKTPQNNTLI